MVQSEDCDNEEVVSNLNETFRMSRLHTGVFQVMAPVLSCKIKETLTNICSHLYNVLTFRENT